MDEAVPHGPQVRPEENLFRAIPPVPSHWPVDRQRPSTAIFNGDKFSVDVASLTSPDVTLSRFRPGTGLVSFNCGKARQLDFDTLHEKDPKVPENDAHANVYDCSEKGKKARRRQLVELSQIIKEPVVPRT